MRSATVFSCDYCSALFVCLRQYQDHKLKHAIDEGKTIFPCARCELTHQTIEESLKHSLREHKSDEPTHSCEICCDQISLREMLMAQEDDNEKSHRSESRRHPKKQQEVKNNIHNKPTNNTKDANRNSDIRNAKHNDSQFQGTLFGKQVGPIIQKNSTRIVFALTIGLLLLCVAIKSAKLDAELTSWIQRTERVESELQYVNAAIGEGTGSTSQLLLQTPRQLNGRAGSHDNNSILSVESLMIHLEAMAIATHVTIDLYDVSWSLKDICLAPTLPEYEGLHVGIMIDNMMPCAIKTPLDCFWEGAKLLGPEQPVSFSSIGPKLKWTSLNPLPMVEAMQRNHQHASFPYKSLINWMKRVGITSGYQYKPCLDPTDPNCPTTAPNKFSNEPPNIGAWLTGGCRGLASNQWHWKEEEIVGGIIKNKTGHIVHADALQSTIQLMGEQDMYDYWRKTSKVQDVNNWSLEKARFILDTWQRKFEEELAQFTRASSSSKSYKIHTMTSKSMLNPIDLHSLLDLTTFELCLALMTLYACFCFPKFPRKQVTQIRQIKLIGDCATAPLQATTSIPRTKIVILAIVTSSFIGLTFIASLGVSSFMNLPFNMATTQILPPLALYYGFNQLIMIANIYSRQLARIPVNSLTASCLDEMLPIIKVESITYITALLVATIFPVEATRVFLFQAIIYILVGTLNAIILVPSIMTTFILHNTDYDIDSHIRAGTSGQADDNVYISSDRTSPFKFTLRRGNVKQTHSDNSNIEEQIFSRIQDDLKNIQADTHYPTDINFTAHIGQIRTSFNLSTSQPSSQNKEADSREVATLPSDNENESKSQHTTISDLPDLLQNALLQTDTLVNHESTKCDASKTDISEQVIDKEHSSTNSRLMRLYAKILTSFRYVQALICIATICSFVAFMILAPKVKYGLRLMDIVAYGTPEYGSLSIQERYFPVYNAFIATKGNFDYSSSSNQRLLHELYKSIDQVDGVISDGDSSRFWLIRFRDWLLELQRNFDIDRNKSAIFVDGGWNTEASDEFKLAYKLLAHTGKLDNPVDKAIVETNRLVDDSGIINPKAFYYYLTAWVINNPFTYSLSEANFKPEPKVWNDNPDNLKVEKARPLTYTQIPFLLKISPIQDNLKTISEIRRRSQAFEQLNLPNFPTGIPFIFWDQFLSLDLFMFIALVISTILIMVLVGILTMDFKTAAIFSLLACITVLEVYSFLGYSMIPFNSILAALLIGTMGIAAVQSVHYATHFNGRDGDLATRAQDAVKSRFRTVISSLGLFITCILSYQYSRIDFINKYSYLLIALVIINSFNSLLLVPIILSVFGSKFKPKVIEIKSRNLKSVTEVLLRKQVKHAKQVKHKHRFGKKRGYPRIQTEISLSTISEEPHSEAPGFVHISVS